MRDEWRVGLWRSEGGWEEWITLRDEWRVGLQRSEGGWEGWIVERDINEEFRMYVGWWMDVKWWMVMYS